MEQRRKADPVGRGHQFLEDSDGEGCEQDITWKHPDQLEEGRDGNVRQEVQHHWQRKEGLHHRNGHDKINEGKYLNLDKKYYVYTGFCVDVDKI